MKTSRALLIVLTVLFLSGCYAFMLTYETPDGQKIGFGLDRRPVPSPKGYSK